jgi:hypothetical protein
MSNLDQYWASVPGDQIGSQIMERVTEYKQFLKESGKLEELRKSYDTFYGPTAIEDVDQSLKAIHVNHYANLIRHVLVDVTSQRPAWEPRAVNTDMETQADTQLASGLLDYYMREKHIEPILNGSIEQCLFQHESWVTVDWNVSGGEVYGVNPDNNMPIYEGDVDVKMHHMLHVARDVHNKSQKLPYTVITEFENKWDLVAQFPDMADKIKSLKPIGNDDIQYELVQEAQALKLDVKTDLIPVYTLRHEKTPAMPQGRMTKVLSADVKLLDGPLPYKRAYVFPASPAQKYMQAFGHSYLLDLLGPQDAFNATVSAILTNQAANAVQNFQVPKGAAPRVVALADGMNVWEYDPKAGKLERMDLLGTPVEVFNFAEFMLKQKDMLAGVGAVSKGDAPATMSGTAMALLAQQSIQFSSGVQLSRTLLQENVGTAIIELLQTFAVVPRVAMIVGKAKRPLMRYFKGSDLKGISRVICDTANPLTKTAAGRVEVAKDLLANNMIKSPQQYISVLTTGNLEPLYEHEQGQNNLIRAENEWLMEAKPVMAVMTDDDALHVLEHSCIFNSPEARENPQVIQNALMHIQQHIDQAKSKDPALAMMLKQQSFFVPPPMPGMPPGAPQGGPMPSGEAGAVMDNQNPVTAEAEQTALPAPAQPPEIGGM